MSLDNTTAIALAFIAAVPSFWAIINSRRARREAAKARDEVRTTTETVTATEFGTAMAKEAFVSLGQQVRRLEKGRTDADHERTLLTSRIDHLTELLQLTNSHLMTLMHLLDQHGIPRPPMPLGISLNVPWGDPSSGSTP